MLLLLWGGVSEGRADEDKKLQEIRDKITRSSERAQTLEKESNLLGQKIQDLRQNLVTAAREIQDTESAVYEKETSLAALNTQEQTLQTALSRRYAQMAKTLAAMQRLSQRPAVLAPYRPDKAINSLRSASLLKRLQPELEQRAAQINHDMSALNIVREQLEKERAELAFLLDSLTVEQKDMDRLLAQRQTEQDKLRQATKAERAKLKKFAATAKNLKELIARIKKENEQRRQAALAAAKRLVDKPDDIRKSARQKLKRPELSRPPAGMMAFDRAKGTLPLPARGKIRQTFGTRTAEGLTAEGITIHTLPQATVVAPHEGRVIFAGKFRTYGQLLIIAHGADYHVLLAGMTRIDAEVGQWVLKGEPVGQMAAVLAANNSAGQNPAGHSLYVELRQRGKPINPLPWIMAGDRKVL